MSHFLPAFSPPVSLWFRETFGAPTPPQAEGWPPIQRGEHTLILAPTGSGKTLAAFLWGIDQIYRELAAADPKGFSQSSGPGSVRLLYISPLKALNNDIERNLRVPLAGIRAVAARLGHELPPLRVAVRTGDTPGSARVAMLKRPPHILITTPESFYLLLTSPRARAMFRGTRTVIVDEIHTLCGDKRGAHLALSLERLEHLAGTRIQRIGLSATIKPLDEVARFLGGQQHNPDHATVILSPDHPVTLSPRPVTIVDTGYHKPLDLQVVTPVDDFRNLPGDTIWPAVIPRVLGDVMRHRSTLIFCNNRRLAERTADRLNAQIAAERSEEIPPGSTEALAPGGIARDRGMFALGAEGPIRAHHGSMSREARHQMEEELKAGRLPALVGTSSLELGIDIGAVDLVVQLQSPKSVAQGLQRVGRSGHLVGQTSHGRIYATYREDLIEAAAVARGMLDGDIEPTSTPQNPLDVLAQQIVAMVSLEEWFVPALYDLVRQAYPYRDLPLSAFRPVLDMLSGKYAAAGGAAHGSLRARIAWDRTNDRLAALPGTRLLALSNPGTIPDTGAYDVYLADGRTKVGTLDEEFIFETRVGDTFLLGSNVWRVLDVGDDRIVVGDAAGSVPRMPFWRGDYPWRPFELGARIGRLRREVAERLQETRGKSAETFGYAHDRLGGAQGNLQELIAGLQREYALDESSARNLVDYVQRQLEAVGVIATDDTIVVESFTDAVGDGRLVIHSAFGGRVNGAWALAISGALRERAGIAVETQVNDDGILMRLPQTLREPPVDAIRRMTPAEARERILRELPDSALFGAHFRMNAARALLLPKARGRRRTPFWLQRLKAKDLLAAVRQFDDFPILAETYRDCLRDVLDLPRLEQILAGIQDGSIRVVPIETVVPSPVAAGLLFQFVSVYMYEWDAPKAERQLGEFALRREMLDDLVQGATLRETQGELFKPEAMAEAIARAGHLAPDYGARSAEELAVFMQELGDLTADEALARCNARPSTGDAAGEGAAWLAQLAAQGRLTEISIPAARGPEMRWVPAELADEYTSWKAAETILRRFLRAAGPVTRADILNRYAFDEAWLDATLARLVAAREVLRGRFTPARTGEKPSPLPDQYCDRHLLEQIQRRTLAILRREVQPVSLAVYADFLARWQGLSEAARPADLETLRQVMAQLRGAALPGVIWERDVLPARLTGYEAGDLGMLCEAGELIWAASGREPRRARVRFFPRGEGGLFLPSTPADESGLSEAAKAVSGFLQSEGASFLADIQAGTGLAPAPLRGALVKLALAGLATNDSLDALNAVLSYRDDAPGGRVPLSSLEAELAALRPAHPVGRAPSRDRYRAAKKEIARRLRAQAGTQAPPLRHDPWAGRWFLLHRTGVLGPARPGEARAEAQARVLLARHGVLTHEVVQREEGPREATSPVWDWADLAGQLTRMELRGEVRRGYFVAGLSGVQYALPSAVDALREAAGKASPGETLVILNATDPANIYGGEIPEVTGTPSEELPRFARLPSTYLVLDRGRPVLIAEDNGERMIAATDTPPNLIQLAVRAYLGRPSAPRRVTVEQWNDGPALDGPAEALLKPLGFYRTPTGLEWRAGA